jgi:hypothetical protein
LQIVDGRDLAKCRESLNGRAEASERVGMRAWIVKRAPEMAAEHMLTASRD